MYESATGEHKNELVKKNIVHVNYVRLINLCPERWKISGNTENIFKQEHKRTTPLTHDLNLYAKHIYTQCKNDKRNIQVGSFV